MSDLYTDSALVCRPALPKDTEDVMELCSHIWEGHDYIPSVWQEWLADPEGLLGVAEMGGRVVSVFKLTRFQEDEWYLEGLRVHPDAQGKGVAAHVHNYVVDTWRRMGRGKLRLVTGSYNIKVHHMCEQGGFKRIAEFIPFRAEVVDEETDRFTELNPGEAQAAFEYIRRNPVHQLSSGLINLGWVYGEPQLKHVEERIASRHAWWWKGKQGFLSIFEDDEDSVREPGIQLVACSIADLPELLMDYRRLMWKRGYRSAGWVAPNKPEVISSLEQAGFTRSWDMSIYFYELRQTEGHTENAAASLNR